MFFSEFCELLFEVVRGRIEKAACLVNSNIAETEKPTSQPGHYG